MAIGGDNCLWQPSATFVPKNSFVCIGKAKFSLDILPVKVVPRISSAYVTYGRNYSWKLCKNFDLHNDAFMCGKDVDGSDIYLGKAKFSRDILPVKVVPRRYTAYVTYDGKEFEIDEFEVLCGPNKCFGWVRSHSGRVPNNAITAGKTKDGEDLYIGRTFERNYTLLGKVHCSKECLFAGFDCKERSYSDYEILVVL